MRRLFLGFVTALLVGLGVSFLTSLVICLGCEPEARGVADGTAPLLGIFAGAYVARGKTWISGALVGGLFVVLWIGFWMYALGRFNPVAWITEGLPHLTPLHPLWWALALLTGAMGSILARWPKRTFLVVFFLGGGGSLLAVIIAGSARYAATVAGDTPPGVQVERMTAAADGTSARLLTFDFTKANRFNTGLYDCDSDDAQPFDDANTSFLGQDLSALVDKLNYQSTTKHRQVLCVINGGFFGESGISVAHHEEPIAQDGRALYPVDLLRPKDQAGFFAIRSPNDAKMGRTRFAMLPEISPEEMREYQTVLGGVRPLLVDGRPLPLKPGAGNTTLRCSRTSIGWSADGGMLYILVVRDPDGEAASLIQKKLGTQTGGWDVAQVQEFWEQKHVPFALLLDGGESTQLAFLRTDGSYETLTSGYQYSFTVGYWNQRPLRLTLPILPPSEAHRGVLNYVVVDGPGAG